MRAFLTAIVTVILIAVMAVFALEQFQTGSDVATSTIAVRLDTQKQGR